MKKLLLTLGLIGCTILTHAQETIEWSNGTLTRIIIVPFGGQGFNPTAADGYTFSLYYGPAGSTAEQLIFSGATAQIGAAPGIISGATSVLALPGTKPSQIISVQVRASHPSGIPILGPPVRQVTLGPTAGPGAVIWTIDPVTRTFYLAPEPGTLTLAGLAGLLFGFARWRQR